MTYEQILTKIEKDSASYTEFKKYIDDAGWELWMNDFCEGEEPTEAEIKKIEAIQKEGWNRSHLVHMGYGYHGGGRPRKDAEARRKTISISGTPSELEELKKRAEEEGKNVSRFVLDSIK